MATNAEIKQNFKNVLRWRPELEQAQADVLAEMGMLVPMDRACSHMKIESNGDKNATSDDGAGKGLFQITNPGIPVDWGRVYDPAYNCYLGLKTLATKYNHCCNSQNQCGWSYASSAFFAGHCVDVGALDINNGTSQAEYAKVLLMYIDQMRQIGIGETFAGSPIDPKSPEQPNLNNGGGNTETEDSGICFGPICIPVSMPSIPDISGLIGQGFARVFLVVIGMGILIIGLRRIV